MVEKRKTRVVPGNFSNVISGEIYSVIPIPDYEITRVPLFVLSRLENERGIPGARRRKIKGETRTKENTNSLDLIEADLHNYKCRCYKYDSKNTSRRTGQRYTTQEKQSCCKLLRKMMFSSLFLCLLFQ